MSEVELHSLPQAWHLYFIRLDWTFTFSLLYTYDCTLYTCFSSLSSSTSSTPWSFIKASCCRVVAFQLLTSAFIGVLCHSWSCLLRLPVAVVDLLVVVLSCHRPLICSLQLLVAKVDFSSSQDVLQESHKSGYGPAR